MKRRTAKSVRASGNRSALLALALLALAWIVWGLSFVRAIWISSQFVGPGDDVTDSIRRSGYVASRVWPFDCVTLLAEGTAGIVLLVSWLDGYLNRWGVTACVLWVLSVLLHGACFLLHMLIA